MSDDIRLISLILKLFLLNGKNPIFNLTWGKPYLLSWITASGLKNSLFSFYGSEC